MPFRGETCPSELTQAAKQFPFIGVKYIESTQKVQTNKESQTQGAVPRTSHV